MVACFRACYGDTYPSEDFYDVDRLTARIATGSLRSVIAIVDGVLVGHTGLNVRHPEAKAIEAGNTVVDPAHRGSGLLRRLGGALNELCLAEGYVAFVHYPTTAHEIMQRSSVRGGVETGVMLDYIPAETEYRAVERREGRIAATVVYQPLAPAPTRDVFVPAGYRDTFAGLYAASGLVRTLATPVDRVDDRRTVCTTSSNKRRSLMHFHVSRVGADLRSLVGAGLAEHDAAVVHVDLAMDDPGIGAGHHILRSLGFFYCGLMPEFAGSDVLRLQRLARPAATSFAPALVNPGANELLTLMRSEARAS